MALSLKQFKKAAALIYALNNAERLAIVAMLERKECTATEIMIKLETRQSISNRHLSILYDQQIVDKSRRVGRYVYYRLNVKRLRKAEEAVWMLCE